jgi:hypothetical protein
MGGRGAGSGGNHGGGNDPAVNYDDPIDPNDPSKPPYAIEPPLTISSAITPDQRSLIDALSDTLSELYDKVVAATADGFQLVDDATQVALEKWNGLTTEEQVAILFDLTSIASMFMSGGMSGPGVLMARAAVLSLVGSLIAKTTNGVVEKLSYREAYAAYDLAITSASKAGVNAPALGLQSEAQLSRLNIGQLEAEVARVQAMSIDSDFTAKYENTLLAMIKRERLIDLGKTPKSDPDLPPSTYRSPESDLTRLENRISNPPGKADENTAVAITKPLEVTQPPLAGEALAAQKASDASLSGGDVSIAGSRSLTAEASAQVNRIAAALKKAGCKITTGCATGVDEAVAPFADKINAQFGPNGEGAIPNVSNVNGVKAAELAGADVNYYAGGDLTTSVNTRLGKRSAVTALGSDTTLGIFGSDVSVGTTNTLRTAANAGKSVFALSTNGKPLPSLGNGHWQAVEKAKGIWKGLYRWITNT